MTHEKDILRFYDASGNLACVQISPQLWRLLEPYLDSPAEHALPVEDRASFEELLRFWDFKYPYDPAVRCPSCHNETSDWRTDVNHPFFLANANIGGLVVFHCKKCGSTIRHKYFRDHMTVEFTPAGR